MIQQMFRINYRFWTSNNTVYPFTYTIFVIAESPAQAKQLAYNNLRWKQSINHPLRTSEVWFEIFHARIGRRFAQEVDKKISEFYTVLSSNTYRNNENKRALFCKQNKKQLYDLNTVSDSAVHREWDLYIKYKMEILY